MERQSEKVKGMGCTVEEVEAAIMLSRTRRRTDSLTGFPYSSPALREVCVCGHPLSRHNLANPSDRDGRVWCKPSKMQCGCARPLAVARVGNLLGFVFKTTGPGPAHALMKGASWTVQRDLEFTWLSPGGTTCAQCKRELDDDDGRLPIAVTTPGTGVSGLAWDTFSARYSGILCMECYTRYVVGETGSGASSSVHAV